MPDFSRIITMAYMRILGRPPDPGGLENYDRAMNSGLTEAQMRESLLRSKEYAKKNPDKTVATVRRASPSRKKKTGKKTTGKKKAASAKKKRRSSRS
jgi:hypothetical protein